MKFNMILAGNLIQCCLLVIVTFVIEDLFCDYVILIKPYALFVRLTVISHQA